MYSLLFIQTTTFSGVDGGFPILFDIARVYAISGRLQNFEFALSEVKLSGLTDTPSTIVRVKKV